MNEAAAPSRRPGEHEMTTGAMRLPDILLTSLTALAAAGEVEQACRLAGQACVMLRVSDPAASRRFDVLLHRLTRKLSW